MGTSKTGKAVLLSIRDDVKLAAPEPKVLRILGEESQTKGELKKSLIAYAEGFVSGHDLSRAVSWGQRRGL